MNRHFLTKLYAFGKNMFIRAARASVFHMQMKAYGKTVDRVRECLQITCADVFMFFADFSQIYQF